jgi:phenylacetate-CoA ligase
MGELLNGSNILSNYKLLQQSDWFEREKLNELQNKYLVRLVHHCYENVPYYTDLFNKNNIKPKDINNRNDLVKIPMLDKQLIRDNYDKLISKDAKNRKTKKHSTGGSTGVPLQFQTDMQTWNMAWASTFRAWQWYGFKLGEKIFTLGGHSLVSEKSLFSKKELFEKYLMRNFKFSSSEMKPDDMQKHYNCFMKIRPSAIRGYASTLYVFAKFIEENNLPVHPIKLILTTGEVLLPTYRSKIQEIFQAPIYDNYGAGDGGIASHECYMHEGLHITEERCIIEICDNDGNVLEDGNVGNVITTDLHNYVFPFLRYNLGDMSYIKKNLCSCGRKSRLFGEVMGRNGKLLYTKSGVPLSPTMLPFFLYPELDYTNSKNHLFYSKIDKFQFNQDENGDLVIFLKMKQSKDEDHKMYEYVIDNCLKYFPNSLVEIKFVNQIPLLNSGKEDYVVSNFQQFH